MVELISRVVGYCIRRLLSCLPIADVVVIVGVEIAAYCGCGEFTAVVVAEAVVHRLPVAGGIAGGRTTKDIVGISTLSHKGAAAMVLIAEVLACAAAGKSCTADAPIRTVAGRDSVLHRSVLAVYRVPRNDRIHSLFG